MLSNSTFIKIDEGVYMFICFDLVWVLVIIVGFGGVVFCLEKGSCYIGQASLELSIILPQLPNCWDYRYAPLCLGFMCDFLKTK
jgi:hypothetical protein